MVSFVKISKSRDEIKTKCRTGHIQLIETLSEGKMENDYDKEDTTSLPDLLK